MDMKFRDSIRVEVQTMFGVKEYTGSIVQETTSTGIVRTWLYFNGESVDITLALSDALRDAEHQNEYAPIMEIKYNERTGRYLVRDMTLLEVIFSENGTARCVYHWKDCDGDTRVYGGIWCEFHSSDFGAYLRVNRPTFYF